jgi:ATP-binding cassette, subfamily B, multidrug efflux pump
MSPRVLDSPGRPARPRLVVPMEPYARRSAGLLVIGSVAGILMNTAVVLPSVALGHAVDTVEAYDRGQVDAHTVTSACLLLLAAALATEIPRIGKRFWLGVARSRVCADLRSDALVGVLTRPGGLPPTMSVGDAMARIVADIEVIRLAVGEVIVETWDTLLFSFSLVVAMLVYDPTMGVAAVAPVPIALVLAKAAGAAVGRRTLVARGANATTTTFVQQGLTGHQLLRVTGRAPAWTQRLSRIAAAQAEAELATTRLQAALAPVYTTITWSGVVFVFWYGGHEVVAGHLSVGDLVAFLTLFARFTGRAFRIPQMANRIQAGAAALSRVSPLLANPPPLSGEPRHASWQINRVSGLTEAPTAGAARPENPAPIVTEPSMVVLAGVTFAYPGSQLPALNGISLELERGTFTAVTGPVGSGKSALARVIAGLYEIRAGHVSINGADPYTDQDVRAALGYVPQGHPVFAGTVADNIRLLREPRTGDAATVAAEERLTTAVAVAGLEDEVAAMPAALKTQIGELGVRISGGQGQRVALARALAASDQPPRLLVLDDPFSALDVNTEALVVAALREAVGPTAPSDRRATVLLCSTRLAAFPHADQVVVLEHGRITQRGSHAALMTTDGLYSRIGHAQQRSHSAGSEPTL